jgi:parallel beta-helix repeat protein
MWCDAMATGDMLGQAYFVDASYGDDANDGLSQSTAWKSLARVNAWSFLPGDQILLRAGEVWREELILSSSGTLDNPIVLGTYGEGAKPIISAGALLDGPNSWEPGLADTERPGGATPVNVWYAEVENTANVLLFGRSLGTRVAALSDLVAAGEWYAGEDVVYVYATVDPDLAPAGSTIEVSQRDYAIVNQQSNIVIQSIQVELANLSANLFNWTDRGNQQNIHVRDVDSLYSAQDGIFFGNASAVGHTSDVTVENCQVSYSGSSGINIQTGCDRVIVKENFVEFATLSNVEYQAGIHVWGNTTSNANLQIINNEVSHCRLSTKPWASGNGIHVDEVAPGGTVLIDGNTIHDNDGIGIFIEHSANVIARSNMLQNNGEDGILVFRECTGVRLLYNTCVGNKYGASVVGDGGTCEMIGNIVYGNDLAGNQEAALRRLFGGENDGMMGYGNRYIRNTLV